MLEAKVAVVVMVVTQDHNLHQVTQEQVELQVILMVQISQP